jgi:hypothetical protein
MTRLDRGSARARTGCRGGGHESVQAAGSESTPAGPGAARAAAGVHQRDGPIWNHLAPSRTVRSGTTVLRPRLTRPGTRRVGQAQSHWQSHGRFRLSSQTSNLRLRPGPIAIMAFVSK